MQVLVELLIRLHGEIESYSTFNRHVTGANPVGGTTISPEACKGQKGDVLSRALNGAP